MSRYFEPMSQADFKQKLAEVLLDMSEFAESEEPAFESVEEILELTEPELMEYLESEFYDFLEHEPAVQKDISKIDFGFENLSMFGEDFGTECSGMLGLNHMNGMFYIGAVAGESHQIPVFFIIYHDGKTFRGYVPREGNTWNVMTKEAATEHEFPCDEMDLEGDITNRIVMNPNSSQSFVQNMMISVTQEEVEEPEDEHELIIKDSLGIPIKVGSEVFFADGAKHSTALCRGVIEEIEDDCWGGEKHYTLRIKKHDTGRINERPSGEVVALDIYYEHYPELLV